MNLPPPWRYDNIYYQYICWSFLSLLIFFIASFFFFSLLITFLQHSKPQENLTLTQWGICSVGMERGILQQWEETKSNGPKVLTMILNTRNSLLVKFHSSNQEGNPFGRRHIDDKRPAHHHPQQRTITAELPFLTPVSISFAVLQSSKSLQSSCIIFANKNVTFHCWLPQTLKYSFSKLILQNKKWLAK